MTIKAIPLPKLSGFTERDGNWYAEEIPLADLAKEFGTPRPRSLRHESQQQSGGD